jgi:PKD repeat protein
MHGSVPAYEGIVGVGLDAKTYKYVELTSAGQFELYNLDGDPWELTNLAGNAGYSAIQADLAVRLATHLGGPPANQPPMAAFTQSCSDLTCVFTDASTDSDGSVVSWAWNFGDGTPSSAEDPTHSYGTAGTYSATLTVTDDDGATSAVTHSITVTNPNGPPVAGFTSACTALTCDFTDTSAGSVVSWLWTFGDGSSSTAQDPSHSYGTAGTYTVTLDVTDDQGATGAASSSVTVSEPGAATTMHVTDLDGTRANQRGSWLATVHIYVGNELGGVVSSAQVTISRRNGTTSSCTTNAAGYCFVQFTVQGPKEVFTVTGVTHPTLTYQAGDNADPDGDSTGTQITILRS